MKYEIEEEDLQQGVITDMETGEKMSAEEAQKMKQQLESGDLKIEFAPGMENFLEEAGMTMEELKQAFIDAAKRSLDS